MGDDEELRRRFGGLGAWYEQQVEGVPARSRPTPAPRQLRRGLVGLSALAAGVGVIVVSVAVNGLSPRPDDPQVTLQPTPVTSSPSRPTPSIRSSAPQTTAPSPTGSESGSASPRPSQSAQPSASAGAHTTASDGAGVGPGSGPSPAPGDGGVGVTSAPGGGTGPTTTQAEPMAPPAPVAVTNGTFEQQAPLIGKLLGAAPPGWTGSSGVLGVGWPRYPSSDVAGLSGPTAMTLFGLIATPARQSIGEPVRAGVTYQLTVAIGCRSTPEDFGGARLSLLADGVRVASQEVATAPACGRFTDVTLSWTAPADRAGQPLVIEIAKINQRLVSYVDVDNVRLTAG